MNISKRRRPGLTLAWVTKEITNKHGKLPENAVLVECSAGQPEPTRTFGPFKSIPCEQIQLAGFGCRGCRRVVEVLRQAVGIVPRVCIYTCKCGAITTWEDESQPEDARIWYWSVKFLKKSGAAVAVFNGNKPLSPGFSGQN